MNRLSVKIFLVLCLGLTGCGAMKRVAADESLDRKLDRTEEAFEEIKREISSVREEIRMVGIERAAAIQSDSIGRKVTVEEEFDTSKPVSPETGTPPLKSRTTTRTESFTSSEIDSSLSMGSVEAVNQDHEQSEHSEVETSEEISERTKDVVKTSSGKVGKFLSYVGASAILAVVLYIAFRLFKPRLNGILTVIKTFFKII